MERVRIELTEEQREDLESLLEVLSLGQALLFYDRKKVAHDLREIVLAAPTVTLPDKNTNLLEAAKAVRDLCPLPPIGRADEWPKAWQRFCLAIVKVEEANQ